MRLPRGPGRQGVVVPAAAVFCAMLASAAEPPAASSGHFLRLTDHAWAWVAGDERSSNGALFVGETGVLAVDPGLTPSIARAFLDAAREIAGRPVDHVVLTHWHVDHAAGISCLGDERPPVVAHPRTRRSLAERGARILKSLAASATDPRERDQLETCRPLLPDRLLEEREVFDLGDYRVEVYPPGPAHTRGDLVVWAPGDAVLVTGDLVMNRSCPSMGEGSVVRWSRILEDLAGLHPRHVVPGHFEPGTVRDLERFHDYLAAQIEHVRLALSRGATAETVGREAALPEFSDFREFPQYGATFADNARSIARELQARPARRGETAGFHLLARLDVGKNPHQIAFGPDGAKAYVAVAGADRVAVVDARSYTATGTIEVAGVPLGVAVPPPGRYLLATRFGGDAILRFLLPGGDPAGELEAGGAPSLLVGLNPDGRYLVSSEKAGRVSIVNAGDFVIERSYATGRRPFPPAATSDGRLAFVPNYDDGTVTIVDLWNRRVVDTVSVGENPSGGAVLPGNSEYAVAVRGEDRIAFINTASHRVVGGLHDGIGASPFSIVLSPDGRLAFVNNTGSHDISVITIPERRVVARVPVGETPIVMAVHPSGATLWVSSEGSHRLSVIAIPPRWRAAPSVRAPSEGRASVTEVAILGMIHGGHRKSARWGLDQVRETIRSIRPDVVCAEIPPNRWNRIWGDFTEHGVIEDPRVRRFPEYTDVLLPLAVEMGITIVPCAAWTREMSDLRQDRLRQFETDPALSSKREEYERRLAVVRSHGGNDSDDPWVIHSEAYDERTKEELSLYDAYLNDWVGPGGWTNINEAHMRLIDRALTGHRGERVLITFGASHKYWFLERLRRRDDLRLLDIQPFLPAPPPGG